MLPGNRRHVQQLHVRSVALPMDQARDVLEVSNHHKTHTHILAKANTPLSVAGLSSGTEFYRLQQSCVSSANETRSLFTQAILTRVFFVLCRSWSTSLLERVYTMFKLMPRSEEVS